MPHQNLAVYYGFKAVDGLKHTAYFVGHMEHQAIKAETLTGQVVMDNCIRCHTQLNTEFVKTGRMGYMTQQAQGGKVCWDCHRNVPHGGMNSLMATPNAEGVAPRRHELTDGDPQCRGRYTTPTLSSTRVAAENDELKIEN